MLRRTIYCIIFSLTTTSIFASEVTGSIQTSNTVTTGIEIQLPCNPTSVSHGTVDAQTCAITCSSGYSLSGNTCTLTQSSGGGGGGGGSSIVVPLTTNISTSTGTITNQTSMNSGGINPTLVPKFKDIQWHWAQDFITVLARRSVISNVELFRPEDPLSRSEFIKMIVVSAGWEVPALPKPLQFTDVQKDSWVNPYLQVALERSIIQRATAFRPNDKISRAEVAKILTLAMKYKTTTFKGYFTDVPNSNQLWRYIETMKTRKIFEGQIFSGKLIFRPNDSITRSEISKTLVKTFNLQ